MTNSTKCVLTIVALLGVALGAVGVINRILPGEKTIDKTSINSTTSNSSETSSDSVSDESTSSDDEEGKEIENTTFKYFLQQSTSESADDINYELELNQYKETEWVYFENYTIDFGRAYRVKIEKHITYINQSEDVETTYSNDSFEWGNTGTGSFFYWTGSESKSIQNHIKAFKGGLYFVNLAEDLVESVISRYYLEESNASDPSSEVLKTTEMLNTCSFDNDISLWSQTFDNWVFCCHYSPINREVGYYRIKIVNTTYYLNKSEESEITYNDNNFVENTCHYYNFVYLVGVDDNTFSNGSYRPSGDSSSPLFIVAQDLGNGFYILNVVYHLAVDPSVEQPSYGG